jgi:hypothetical protein
VDQSTLTGESLPVEKHPGEVAYSGSIIRQGEMDALVINTGMFRTRDLPPYQQNYARFNKMVKYLESNYKKLISDIDPHQRKLI